MLNKFNNLNVSNISGDKMKIFNSFFSKVLIGYILAVIKEEMGIHSKSYFEKYKDNCIYINSALKNPLIAKKNEKYFSNCLKGSLFYYT